MNWTRNMKEWFAAALLVVGVALFISSLSDTQAPGDTSRVAQRVERVLERRVARLDGYLTRALAQDPAEWLSLEGLPRDFVVYRYCKDTLQSWCHEFPITNDRIDIRALVPYVSSSGNSVESPLLQVSDSLSFCNFGSRWYLAKWAGDADVRVYAGMEITNDSAARPSSRISRYLRLPVRFAIRPLSTNGGTAVYVAGRPQFKIVQETLAGAGRDATPLLWISIAVVLIAFLLFLSAGRSRRRFFSVAFGAVVLLAGLYFWGRFSRNRVLIFSPILYAGGDVLYSLGAVILINLAFVMCAGCAYMVRKNVWEWMNTRTRRLAVLIGVLALAVGVIVYSQSALRSIILNSGFSLEIYKLSQLSPFCVVVYLSFITLLLSVPLLLQVAAPALPRFGHRPYDAFSLTGRVVYAVATSRWSCTSAGWSS